MPTITGTYRRGGGTPERGWLLFTPTAAITDGEEVILPSAERVPLEVDGSFEVDLEATDDTSWIPTGWVWRIDERLPGGRTWNFELTADTDIGDLIPVEVPDSYLPWVFTADATTTAPGTDADVDVTHVGNAVGFAFGVPRGDKGETGDEGPPNVLSIGTVTTEAPGDPATAEITGTSPAQVLNLGIPEGDKGDKGDQGDPGPTTDLSAGTVTTGAPGSSASAAITGTPPTLELDLTIPRGDVGATGPANELSIGTVTTGAAGGVASATITGTPPTQTLDLTIPQGAQGVAGDVAPGNIGNLLPLNVANGSESGAVTSIAWRSGFTSVSSVANSAVQGARAIKVERLLGTSGNPSIVVGSATTGALTVVTSATASTPVVGGQPYTLTATVWSDIGFVNTVGLEIFWRLADGTTAASVGSVASAAQPITTTTPTVRTVTGRAPLDAVLCLGRIGRNTNTVEAAGTYFYVDDISIHRGPGGIAALPGVPITGLGTRTNPDNTAQVQVWNGHSSTWVTV